MDARFDIKRLRKEAAARAIKNGIEAIAAKHEATIIAAIREDNRRTGDQIDNAMRRPKNPVERAITRQLTYDRLTIADHCEHNPVLAKLYRAMQMRAYK